MVTSKLGRAWVAVWVVVRGLDVSGGVVGVGGCVIPGLGGDGEEVVSVVS